MSQLTFSEMMKRITEWSQRSQQRSQNSASLEPSASQPPLESQLSQIPSENPGDSNKLIEKVSEIFKLQNERLATSNPFLTGSQSQPSAEERKFVKIVALKRDAEPTTTSVLNSQDSRGNALSRHKRRPTVFGSNPFFVQPLSHHPPAETKSRVAPKDENDPFDDKLTKKIKRGKTDKSKKLSFSHKGATRDLPIFEKEHEKIVFAPNLPNRLRRMTNDNDCDTDEEHVKDAIHRCLIHFRTALDDALDNEDRSALANPRNRSVETKRGNSRELQMENKPTNKGKDRRTGGRSQAPVRRTEKIDGKRSKSAFRGLNFN